MVRQPLKGESARRPNSAGDPTCTPRVLKNKHLVASALWMQNDAIFETLHHEPKRKDLTEDPEQSPSLACLQNAA